MALAVPALTGADVPPVTMVTQPAACTPQPDLDYRIRDGYGGSAPIGTSTASTRSSNVRCPRRPVIGSSCRAPISIAFVPKHGTPAMPRLALAIDQGEV